MVNISLEELRTELESKGVVAKVNTDDGGTVSICLSLKILENSAKQDGKCEIAAKTYNIRSPVECDTSGCMNSSPDSDRSGVLNCEFVDNGVCNVDDFLNNFEDPAFQIESQPALATVNEGIVDEAECESIADSDCNSADDEYFVIDELVGKRFNDKTQKYEFLLRPKRYIPKNDIIWNPIDNTDNFDVSLLEHGRLYIEVPDSLKKEERRKRSVLQDKFLSEVNIPSGQKSDYLPVGAELRNSTVCRKLDTSMVIDGGLKFDKIYAGYLTSTESTLEAEMGTISSNFDELVPVVPVLIDSQQHQVSDTDMFQILEQKPKKEGKSRQRAEKTVYHCANCDFEDTVKRKITQHVRLHLTHPIRTNNVRQNNRGIMKGKNGFSQHPKRICHKKMKLTSESNVNKNRSTKSKTTTKRTMSQDAESANDVSVKKESEDIENNFIVNSPENISEMICNQKLDGIKSESLKLPEDNANPIDENSTTISNPLEIHSNNNSVRQRVRKVRKSKNTLAVEKGQTVLETEQPKSEQSFNLKVARKRRNLKINAKETENTLNGQESKKTRKTLILDDDRVSPNFKILDELPNDLLPLQKERTDNADEELKLSCAVKSSPVSISIENEPLNEGKSTRLTIPVSIPLRVLENSEIDVEELKKRLLKEDLCGIEDSSPITEVDVTSVEETLYSQSEVTTEVPEVTTEVLPSASMGSQTVQNISAHNVEDEATDEKVISDVIRDMIKSIESKSINSISTSTNSSVEKIPEVQKPKLLFKSSKESGPSIRFRCRFCNFVAVGNATYRKHVIKSHVDKFTQCTFCTKSFMSESSMKEHQLEKHAEYFPTISLPRLSFPDSSDS